MTKRKIEYWVIPPEQDAEFVANMEEVLETYAQAYDPEHPVLCMDEQPVQLLKETKEVAHLLDTRYANYSGSSRDRVGDFGLKWDLFRPLYYFRLWPNLSRWVHAEKVATA